MIRRGRSSLILFLCLQTMAVAIICLGSLINFHQYKIWGKPLIPNFVGYKRDIEKYSRTVSFSKIGLNNQHHQNDFSGNDFDSFIETPFVHCGSGSLISFSDSEYTPATNRISSSGLRGPPISWISAGIVKRSRLWTIMFNNQVIIRDFYNLKLSDNHWIPSLLLR